MGVSDLALVKSVFVSGGKLLVKGALKTSGSHSWSATKAYWKKLEIEELTNGSKHHWAITQDLMEDFPGLKPFGNQFQNVVKFSSHADHIRFGHGQNYQGLKRGNLLQRYWYGTPMWFKTTVNYGANQLENHYIRKQ